MEKIFTVGDRVMVAGRAMMAGRVMAACPGKGRYLLIELEDNDPPEQMTLRELEKARRGRRENYRWAGFELRRCGA
ncbi:hypothetical protein G7K71_08510 [Desulfofundulus sp. TPOSR]|uniref:hypothetical protein n=1 Tax=Desulfofundulus sp. TPOSR TaxID=2714340 RepID=UPI00140DEEA5|nr:hypothetical protein [Desulfofundulus sp. TPOSR]NHM25436.1 hypothetical protein [Desulfofundulus sp. TPOSR]NHM27025.1 hypothetical protein [Desulfofundulus sp. TPOSR]